MIEPLIIEGVGDNDILQPHLYIIMLVIMQSNWIKSAAAHRRVGILLCPLSE